MKNNQDKNSKSNSSCVEVFPHQLFEEYPFSGKSYSVYLVEEFLFFKHYNFHKQKIAFHRATMKYYEQFLLKKNISVNYIEASESISDIRNLLPWLAGKGVRTLYIIDPVDDWLMKRIEKGCLESEIKLEVVDTPLFLNRREELHRFFTPSKKKFFQTEFYKQERVKLKILLDASGNPEGGKWSFDEDNRKRYPKGKSMVSVSFPPLDSFMEEAIAYTLDNFGSNLGSLDKQVRYPIGFDASKQWLNQFLQERMAAFGDYEDAIVHKELVLHHSLLTPMLNSGILTPKQVLETSLRHAREKKVPMNSLEGFVRQIIGWREFIRGVYCTKGVEERTKNYWGFTKKIPPSFYDGTTGILPVDETIKKVLRTGYCHHIERLMVLGNFMLLCEFDPDEVYRWFMELFIDAYDWVMVPNVYGMSQFADGGMMATKPYISGSSYLMKMSDYPKGEWQEVWDVLFWRFMDKHRNFFLSNPRLGMLVKTFDKWEEDKRMSIHEKAERFLSQLGIEKK